MDFTREPIIQTIITPKEGCKLVVRSSKNAGQEEYFVDAVEVVSFDHASFFRSLERPKPFLVPIADYEVLEVREARMVLKSVGIDRSIKIGGGRESTPRPSKGADKEVQVNHEPAKAEVESSVGADGVTEVKAENRPGLEKKRDRRRQYRKRRGGQTAEKDEDGVLLESSTDQPDGEKVTYPVSEDQSEPGQPIVNPFSSLLQPPPTLISETINRYRENALFKSAFFLTEEEQYKPHDKVQELLNDDEDESEGYTPILKEPVFVDPHGLPERSFDFLKDPHSELHREAPHVHGEAEEDEYADFAAAPAEEFIEPVKLPEVIELPAFLESIDQPIEAVDQFIALKEDKQAEEQKEKDKQEQKEVEEPEVSSSLPLYQDEDDEKFGQDKKE